MPKLIKLPTSPTYEKKGYEAYSFEGLERLRNDNDYQEPSYAWGGKKEKILHPVFFLIKTNNEKGDNTEAGFQLNIYSNSATFRDRYKNLIVPVITKFLGNPIQSFVPSTKHYVCIVWNYDASKKQAAFDAMEAAGKLL